MNIKRISTYDDRCMLWAELVSFSNFEFLEYVKNDVKAIKKLAASKFKDIPDKEFSELVSHFYSIRISKEELLDIISKTVGVEYNKVQRLRTSMAYIKHIRIVCEELITSGDVTFQNHWWVSVSKDFMILSDKIYSVEDIKNLIEDKKIVCLGQMPIQIDYESDLSFEAESEVDLEPLQVCLNQDDISTLFFGNQKHCMFKLLEPGDSVLSKQAYKTTIYRIRKRLNKKKVLARCKEIILFINNNIMEVEAKINKKSFETEEERKYYLDLLNQIKSDCKELF